MRFKILTMTQKQIDRVEDMWMAEYKYGAVQVVNTRDHINKIDQAALINIQQQTNMQRLCLPFSKP